MEVRAAIINKKTKIIENVIIVDTEKLPLLDKGYELIIDEDVDFRDKYNSILKEIEKFVEIKAENV